MAKRYIKSDVSKAVQKRHFFECAWCGIKLTERHHIEEFAKGGEHTEENLILLCPNCHTQVHKNKIRTEELIKRKSTHLKGDRLAGGVQFELQEPVVILGMAKFTNVPNLIMYGDEPIINLEKTNEEFFLSTRFYNKLGDLIFWMSSNRYWASSDFKIESTKNELLIINSQEDNNTLRIWQTDNVLNLEGKNYINGMLIDINPLYLKIGTATIYGFSVTNSYAGIGIAKPDFPKPQPGPKKYSLGSNFTVPKKKRKKL